MAFEDCPSGLYETGCENGRYCVPVVHDAEGDSAGRLAALGFNVFSYTRQDDDMSVRTCSAILQPGHAEKLAQLTGELPDVTERDIKSGVEGMWQIRQLEELRYQDRVAADKARGWI